MYAAKNKILNMVTASLKWPEPLIHITRSNQSSVCIFIQINIKSYLIRIIYVMDCY